MTKISFLCSEDDEEEATDDDDDMEELAKNLANPDVGVVDDTSSLGLQQQDLFRDCASF